MFHAARAPMTLGYTRFVWIGLFEPSERELAQLEKNYGLHPLAIEDALRANQMPKVDVYGDQSFVMTRTAHLEHDHIAYGETAITHKFLLGELWGNSTNVQYLRVHVRQQKIETDPERPKPILTESCISYRLREAEQLSMQVRCA
jgi:Mg2+ and Co2+ transporter CorA